GQGGAPPAHECIYSSFMKCNPTSFHGNKGAVELCRWFKKTESVFSISECAERNKVKFVAATLQGQALTWWNSQVATLGLEIPIYLLTPKGLMNWSCYAHKWFRAKRRKWRHTYVACLKTLKEKQLLNEAVRMAHTLMEQKLQAKAERISESNKRKAPTTTQNAGANQTGVASKCNRCGICHFDQCPPKCNNCGKMGHKEKDCRSRNVASGTNARSAVVCYECGERGHKSNACPKKADRQGGNVQDKSFVDVRFSHLLDIKPAKLNTSYEVELADGKVVCTNTVLKGCTLNLLDHLFDIDLMPIELGTVIVCGKKEVHVPFKNKTLVVKGDSGASRLKVVSCIKARKYIKRGSQLFLAQVTEK
ncbi:putative reverse transcriptase domain-containing protein, partial [Tanacetum coccineum]